MSPNPSFVRVARQPPGASQKRTSGSYTVVCPSQPSDAPYHCVCWDVRFFLRASQAEKHFADLPRQCYYTLIRTLIRAQEAILKQ